MSHMTQTANPVTLLASPLGEEGHEVAKGWTVVRMIMILDVDVTAEGGIIKLIANSRGNERYEGKKQRVIYFTYHSGVFPLWWLAPPPSRPSGKRVTGFSVAYGSLRIQFPCHRKRGTIKLRYAVSCL